MIDGTTTNDIIISQYNNTIMIVHALNDLRFT